MAFGEVPYHDGLHDILKAGNTCRGIGILDFGKSTRIQVFLKCPSQNSLVIR